MVQIESMYLSLISPQKDKWNSFISQLFSGDLLLLGIFFRASNGSLSVNSISHSKLPLSDSLGIWRVSKKFVCSDNVFLMFFSRSCIFRESVILCLLATSLPTFPGNLALFPNLEKYYWIFLLLCNAGIYFELLHSLQFYHIFHQVPILIIHIALFYVVIQGIF